jgi:hypothetical protein
MSDVPFAKELPIADALTEDGFVAEVIGWLRGIRDSRVLASAPVRDLDLETP